MPAGKAGGQRKTGTPNWGIVDMKCYTNKKVYTDGSKNMHLLNPRVSIDGNIGTFIFRKKPVLGGSVNIPIRCSS